MAVVSDLAAIAALEPERPVATPPQPASRVDPEFLSAHYLRFVIKDRPGVLAALATILASHDINIDAVLQHRVHSKEANAFVVTIERCAPATVATALSEIAELDFHVAPTVDLPILSDGSEG